MERAGWRRGISPGRSAILGIADFASRLAQCKVVALDAMVFIYHFENHPSLANLTQLIFDRMEAGLLTSLVSVIGVTEIYSGPLRKGYSTLFEEYKRVFITYPNLLLMPVTLEVGEQAAILRAKYEIRTPDAIHIATGVVHQAEAFISNDEALRSVEELPILLLSDFARTGGR